MNNTEVIRRITYAKFLLLQGNEALQSMTPISDGLAVSLYQDAAEMLLLTVAEYLNANVGERTPFNKIITKIEEAKLNNNNAKISSKIAISQLNKSRVNFKHYGLLPTNEDAKKISHDIEIFFQRTVEDFFNLNYEEISLTDVIQNDRIRNFLKVSEMCLHRFKYDDAIINSSKAFRLIIHKINATEQSITYRDFRGIDNRELTEVIQHIESTISNHELQLNLLKFGINLTDYSYFKSVTPVVHLTAANTFFVGSKKYIPDDEIKTIAKFCVKFVIHTSLQVAQKQYLIKKPYREDYKRKFIVTKPTEIIVYPVSSDQKDKYEVEVIKKVEKGAELIGSLSHRDKDKFIAIIHDDETVYIAKEAVQVIK